LGGAEDVGRLGRQLPRLVARRLPPRRRQRQRRHAGGRSPALKRHASARWRAINWTAKSRKWRWSRPAGWSANLARRASPANAACMWAALKSAMAYWVSESRGGVRFALRAALVRAR